MIASMTSFGRIEETTSHGHVVWDIRTVNHRYLDINLRMPEEMRPLEASIRQKISTNIKRGKVDCNLRFDMDLGEACDIKVNEDRAHRVTEVARRLSEPSTAFSTINPIDVMRWPGVVERDQIDIDVVGATLLTLLDKALLMVSDTRKAEGDKLQQMIRERCEQIQHIVTTVKSAMPELIQQLHDKYRARINELLETPDMERLDQEIVMLAQKADVAEELDRLEAHLSEVDRALSAKEPVGRRLDFLMQEMNREANTLGSKSVHINMTNASVDLKVLIEQMREQIQNIE